MELGRQGKDPGLLFETAQKYLTNWREAVDLADDGANMLLKGEQV